MEYKHPITIEPDKRSDKLERRGEPDPVIEAFKKDVDRTLLRENLKLTVQERLEKFERFCEYARELREAGRRAGKRTDRER